MDRRTIILICYTFCLVFNLWIKKMIHVPQTHIGFYTNTHTITIVVSLGSTSEETDHLSFPTDLTLQTQIFRRSRWLILAMWEGIDPVSSGVCTFIRPTFYSIKQPWKVFVFVCFLSLKERCWKLDSSHQSQLKAQIMTDPASLSW